jgi:hypothetical protein
MNIERRTSNIERRTSNVELVVGEQALQGWVFNVRCSNHPWEGLA